jgi:hypothetical protein
MNAMKSIYMLPVVVVLLVAAACARDHITTYESEDYIHFDRRFADSSSFSFVAYPNDNEYAYPVVVALVGQSAPRDRAYNVEVIDSYTTAPAANYQMPTSFTLRANTFADTFRVKLVKTPDLQTRSVRLALRVTGSDDLLTGELERNVFVLWFTDRIGQPSWWDNTIRDYFLGNYSDKKYRLFIQVTGVGDMSGMEYYDRRYHTLIFKNYLRDEKAKGPEHIVYEEDNITEMSVTLVGG